MKIQINAAQRLKAETDRVEMARSYLESLGVEVGALESQSRTLIEFMIPYTSFDLVKGKLIKKLGRPQDINSQEPDTHLRWTIKGKGFVILYRNEYNEADVGVQNAPTRASWLQAAKDDNGDKERLAQLTKQIKMFEADVKEIEDDGDDATVERKHLESLRDEQRRLKEKVGIKASRRTRAV